MTAMSNNWQDFSVWTNEFKKLEVTTTSKVYLGTKFRKEMTLIMEKNTQIGTNAVILVPELTMKEGSQINAGAILFGRAPITIGKNSVISYGCVVGTSSDTLNGRFMNDASPENQRVIKVSEIKIGENVFIGANSIIMPGVTIGDNSVIGAGSYISRNIPANVAVIPNQEVTIRERII